MKKYILNLFMVAASVVFFYNGAQDCSDANKFYKEAAQIVQTEETSRLKQAKQDDARFADAQGATCFAFGGLFLGGSGLEAAIRRRRERAGDISRQ